MGITLSNNNRSISLGYGGFNRLRSTISKLLGCQEFADVYSELLNPHDACKDRGFTNMADYYQDHDARAIEICEKYDLDEEIINFLYQSDCDCGSVSVKTCRHIWKVIKDYDDNIAYGYVGRKDCAKFKDFKQIVCECAENRYVMRIS
jgi:hypothetical protein